METTAITAAVIRKKLIHSDDDNEDEDTTHVPSGFGGWFQLLIPQHSPFTFYIIQNTVLESPLEWDAEYFQVTDLLKVFFHPAIFILLLLVDGCLLRCCL